MKRFILILGILVVTFGSLFYLTDYGQEIKQKTQEFAEDEGGGPLEKLHPLSIASLRAGDYSGSDIIIEEELEPGSNYRRYLTSYQSEGLKIYALLTIPTGEKPTTGWPTIVFNHGYIPPAEYRTTERYIAYTDAFSRNGYILFRPDYRGHGSSEGDAVGGYGSNAYTIDVLNALASIKRLSLPEGSTLVDPNRIGFWGHSMGGHITLRSMVVNNEIKAGVIWAGVVASYPDLINNWRRRSTTTNVSPTIPSGARRWRDRLQEEYGTPEKNPSFWNAISSNTYLKDISGPVQLHHGTADTSVPVSFSQNLEKELRAAEKKVEYYEYDGDDHNIAANLGIALERSVAFFDTHVKGTN
jgi:dipeptidyl aminopeptidase/acylaminoacyl peptidase